MTSSQTNWPATTTLVTTRTVRHRRQPGRNLTFETADSKSCRLVVRHEYVAEAPNCLDVNGIGRIGFDDLAQTRNLHVDRTIKNLGVASPRPVHKLVSA